MPGSLWLTVTVTVTITMTITMQPAASDAVFFNRSCTNGSVHKQEVQERGEKETKMQEKST